MTNYQLLQFTLSNLLFTSWVETNLIWKSFPWRVIGDQLLEKNNHVITTHGRKETWRSRLEALSRPLPFGGTMGEHMTWIWHENMKWGGVLNPKLHQLGGGTCLKQPNNQTHTHSPVFNNPHKNTKNLPIPKPILFPLVNLGFPDPRSILRPPKKGNQQKQPTFLKNQCYYVLLFLVKPPPKQKMSSQKSLGTWCCQPLPGRVRHLHPRHASVRPRARKICDLLGESSQDL